jgi:hypothetical protein
MPSSRKPPNKDLDIMQSKTTASGTKIDERVYVNHPTRPNEYIGRVTRIPSGYRAVVFSEAISALRVMDGTKPLPLADHTAVVRRTAPLARFYVQHRWQSDNKEP